MALVRTILALFAGLIGLAVALVVATLSIPFWVVSTLTTVLTRVLQPASVDHGDVIEYDAELGWRGKPDQHCHVLDENGDHHMVTTDAHGWRSRISVAEAEAVVLGDSFAFGDAVGDDDFFANQGGGTLLKAIGAPGYNMVQGLLLMRRLAPELAGKAVVWLVYLGNDLADNLRPEMDGYRTPFLRRAGESDSWHVWHEHVSADRWHFPTRLKAHEMLMEIGVGGHRADRAFDAFRYLVDDARGLLEAVGARLVVMTVPDISPLSLRRQRGTLAERPDLADSDADLPDRRMAEICRQRGVHFVPLADHLTSSDYRENDVHWNEEGNHKVGTLIAELARSNPEAAPDRVHSDPGRGERPEAGNAMPVAEIPGAGS